MRAMVLNKTVDLNSEELPLQLMEYPFPVPKKGEVLIKISTCAVCHTELDEIEGRFSSIKIPVIPGHQVVGRIIENENPNSGFCIGDRVGVAWIFSACGKCTYCLHGFENLCDKFKGTGKDVNGGYAEYMTAPVDFIHRIPENLSDEEAAPMLCAGSIGYRALRLTGIKNGNTLGLMGFGTSAHLVFKMVRNVLPNTRIFVFTKDEAQQKAAKEQGAFWAGNLDDTPPEKINCIIDTTPVWKAVVRSMNHLEKGGRLVINVIKKEEIDKFYLQEIMYSNHLWLEKEIKTVANVTRKDVGDFLALAARIGLKPSVEKFKLEEANTALHELKAQKTKTAKVLVM